MPPVFARHRKNKGTRFFLRGESVVYILTAEKLFTEISNTMWHLEFQVEDNGIYVRTRRYGMLRVIAIKSVVEVKENLLPNAQFYEVMPGLWINLDYLSSIDDGGTVKKMLELDIDGVIERVGISDSRAADLARAFVAHQQRRNPPPQNPTPPTPPVDSPTGGTRPPAGRARRTPARKRPGRDRKAN